MSVNADQLNAATRKRLGLTDSARTRPKPSRAGTGDSEPCPGRCGCGEQFKTAAKWQRHSDKNGAGHTVWSIDLEAPS